MLLNVEKMIVGMTEGVGEAVIGEEEITEEAEDQDMMVDSVTVVGQIAEAARLETNEVVAHSVTREVVRSETKEAAPEIVTETIAFHEARTVEVTTDEVKEV